LWRGSEEIVLRPKATALLGHLLRHSGELVTKQQLLDAVWPDTSVSDAVLKVCISEIRRALGDGATGTRMIETRHGRGYRLNTPIAERESPASGPARPLIAREKNMAALDEHLERAIAGERQTVFVTGEPGVGKTTLVEAFADDALARHVVWAACGHAVRYQGPGEPFEPVLEALNHLSRQVGQEALAALLRTHAPTWLPHLSWASEAPATAEAPAASETSRGRMLREMTDALAVLSSRRPLLLVLEDLHWADCSTLDLVAFLARPLEPARLMIVGTAQPFVSLPFDHPLKAIKQELAIHRRSVELALTPLGAADVAAYLEARCPNGRWPAGLADRIHRRTEGNPLYVASLIDDLVRRNVFVAGAGAGWQMAGSIKEVDAQVPDLVRELTSMSLEHLEARDRRILEAGSVAGREFSAAVVAAALDEDALAIEERCELLVRRQQYIQSAGTSRRGDGRVTACFRFIHAFAQQVLSQQIVPRMRMRFRLRVREYNTAPLEPRIRVAARSGETIVVRERRADRKRR
jgi:DNA-binding winged helix-turn-helix (wHTH) protein